jgi:hypothetical protein
VERDDSESSSRFGAALEHDLSRKPPGNIRGSLFRDHAVARDDNVAARYLRAAKCGYFVADSRSICRTELCSTLDRGCRRSTGLSAVCGELPTAALSVASEFSLQGARSVAHRNKEPRAWRGLIQLFPSGVFRIGKGLLGEAVQLALTQTISHHEGARCDGRHILAHSEPSRIGQQSRPATQRDVAAGR